MKYCVDNGGAVKVFGLDLNPGIGGNKGEGGELMGMNWDSSGHIG